MNKQQYYQKFGKIKIKKNIKIRHPVKNIKSNDPNRNYMIKFKYGNLNYNEEIEFHENIKKLIYKVMHSNNITMDWDDIYQEIWKKIIKCRHTWNESKGTMVSTWITIVAHSVINTLRQVVNKYNSRYCLYEDICSSSEGENSSDREKCDYIQFLQNEGELVDKSFENQIFKEKYVDFLNTLDEGEKLLLTAASEMQEIFIRAHENGVRLPHNHLKQKLGYDDCTYNTLIYNIRKKYCNAFNRKFEEYDNDNNEDSNAFLF